MFRLQMLARSVLLFLVITSLLQAESNSTIDEAFPTSYKSDSNQSIDLTAFKNSESKAETNSSNIIDHSIMQDGNYTTQTVLKSDLNSTVNGDKVKTSSEEMNSTLELLEGYDSVTAAGALQSEPESVDAKDTNNSDVVGPSTKLDDVSTVDIVKEQQKQREIAGKEEKEKLSKPDTQSRALVDTVVVKGSVLQGKIYQLTSEYVSFKLIYGEGTVRINYADIDTLMTEHEYHIYFDGKETQGYITAIKEHAFLQIKHGEIEELITISKIDRFVVSENEDPSFENRVRNTFPYWRGNMDLGIEYEEGSNTKRKLKISGHAERKQTVHKTIFDITYSYEQTQTIDTPTVLNKHELYSFLEQDYAMTESDLLFAEIGYDFDVPRYVNSRLYPSLGYAYRIEAEKKRWVQFKVGVGYVYEKFLQDDSGLIYDLDNQYAAGMLGVDAEYEVTDLIILNRILFGANFFYMPGMVDLKDNWLLRYSLSAAVPLSTALSLKMVGRQVSDDNPSPSVGDNKFTLDVYLSLRF